MKTLDMALNFPSMRIRFLIIYSGQGCIFREKQGGLSPNVTELKYEPMKRKKGLGSEMIWF